MVTPAPQRWPVFICYRRVDGSVAAHRLYQILDRWSTIGAEGQPVQLDVYLDETVPGVANWKEVHRPYLEKARALIVVCTPGIKLHEGSEDWVHRELDWWLRHRTAAPILIDPLMEGLRYVPTKIAERWPDIQRIPLVEKEWLDLTGDALEQKTADLRRHVVGAMLPSGADVYAQEIAAERTRARRLTWALLVVLILLVAVALAAGYAYDRERAAVREQRIADASLLDTQSASAFAEARLFDVRWELEMDRRRDIVGRIAEAPDPVRKANLDQELQQLDADATTLKRRSTDALQRARALLERADAGWHGLADPGIQSRRTRPEPPYIFSIELINAGAGESLLLHYGTPDDVKLVMINAGPRRSFTSTVAARLQQLSRDRVNGGPVPIELFVVGDRDEEKTGGLERLLTGLATQPDAVPVAIRGIWANIFRVGDGIGLGLRPHIRKLIDDLQIPLNKPFDRHVVRPDAGRVQVVLPGGLEIVVLGPDSARLNALYRLSQSEVERGNREAAIEPLIPEGFSNVSILKNAAPLVRNESELRSPTSCVESANARALAGGAYQDRSIPNLASTVLLFQFRSLTFLYTADGRGDLILEALARAGLLDESGRVTVDLMTVPHLGSENNVTVDFFQRVRASNYLFSGNGRFGNPQDETVAALVSARGCDAYRMYFVNRESEDEANRAQNDSEDTFGAKLDAFFKEEERFHPNYRRIFRSSSGGSVIIDMLNPLRR